MLLQGGKSQRSLLASQQRRADETKYEISSGEMRRRFGEVSFIPLDGLGVCFNVVLCDLSRFRLNDAEMVLSSADTEFGDIAPFAMQLLAHIYCCTERRSKAAESQLKALQLNPFLWDSFAQLCHLGGKVEAGDIFQLSNVKNLSACLGNNSNSSSPNNLDNISIVNNLPFNNSPKITPSNIVSLPAPGMVGGGITPDSIVPTGRLRSVFATTTSSPFSPSFGITPLEESPFTLYAPTLTDANEQKAIPKLMQTFRTQVGQIKEAVFSPTSRQTPPRRSTRFLSNNSVKENNKSPNRKFATPKSPSRKNKPRLSKVNTNKINIETTENRLRESSERVSTTTSTINAVKQSSEGLMTLMRAIGEAYFQLAQLKCRHALTLLDELPPQHHNSPWVQSLIAVAHHELAEYEAAAKHFGIVRAAQPLRTEYLDIYSTCLWHLQREVELSALARELVSRDRRCATAWLVAGNCFSLHKEHDTAVRFFRRAVQLQPDRPYSHTLLGHEYVATEETDKALACFRSAVRLDPRHYNAWFGIATVYSKQERFRLAEVHFRKALAIHPDSGVLLCHLGVVLVALGQSKRALETLDRAVAMDPTNPLCCFHRASVLFSAGQLEKALEELEKLKNFVPKESLVYYLLGKVHNKLGNQHLALMHFSWATDLDPKGTSGHIKEAFDPARAENPPDKEFKEFA